MSNANASNRPARVAVALAVLLMAGAPALGQTVTFDPAVSLFWGYTDNVQFLGEEGQAVDTSTSLARVGVLLPVTRQFRDGTLRLSYDVGFTRYDEFDALDDDDHQLSLDLQRKTGRRSTVVFSTSYVRSQSRLGIGDLNRAFFLGPRLRQDAVLAEVGLRREIGTRWRWEGFLGGSSYRLEGISGFDNMADDVLVEERDGYHFATRLSRQATKRTRVGGEYEFRRTDLDVSGEEDLNRLAFLIDRELGRRTGVAIRLGGYRRTRTFGEDKNGIDASIAVRFNDGLKAGPVRFGFDAGVRPDTGGDLGGTAVNLYAGVSMTGAEEKPWTWSLATRWGRRDPFADSLEPELTTVAVTGSLERRFAKVIGVRLSSSWVDQSSDGANAYEGAYYTAGVGLVWYPLGGTRIARPPAEGI